MSYKLQRYVSRKLESELRESLRTFPVTALIGPRQCGKSTLAKRIIGYAEQTTYLDLEKPSDLRKLDDAEFFFHTQKENLTQLSGLKITG